jgi:beta-glucanase (GH16 family)
MKTPSRLWCTAPLGLLFGLFGCGQDDTVITPPIAWYLTWSEEFEGPEANLDRAQWNIEIGTGEGGWGNNERQFYTDRPENLRIDGQGRLEITARREAFGGSAFTSARITTKSAFTQRYGRVEARIQLPQGQGVWPAFWMLGGDIDEVGWPKTGEIDIMEYKGQDPEIVYGSLHGPGYSGANAITSLYRLPDGQNFVEDFHVFAVEWDPSRIAFWVDDQAYQILTSDDVLPRGNWVYDHPFFILLNVAVGGNFVGPPDATTPLPQSMLVDYVRVFSRAPPE